MVGLDIQDEMGRHEVGHIENSMKIPLNQGSGCRFEGEFIINKVRVRLFWTWLKRRLASRSQDILGPVGLRLSYPRVEFSRTFEMINPVVAQFTLLG